MRKFIRQNTECATKITLIVLLFLYFDKYYIMTYKGIKEMDTSYTPIEILNILDYFLPEPPDISINEVVSRLDQNLANVCNQEGCLLLPRFSNNRIMRNSINSEYVIDGYSLFSIRLTKIDSFRFSSSREAAEITFMANRKETLPANKIYPHKLKDTKTNAWVCGFNFCQDVSLRFYEAYFQPNNNIYMLQITGHSKYFDELIPLFEKIVRSVEFIEPEP